MILSTVLNVNDAMNATWNQAEKEVRRRRDRRGMCKICNSACFRFAFLITNVLRSEVSHLRPSTTKRAERDSIPVKMTGSMIVRFKYLGQTA